MINHNHYNKVFTGTIKSLKHWAESICNNEFIKDEYDQLANALHNKIVIQKNWFTNYCTKTRTEKKHNDEDDTDK